MRGMKRPKKIHDLVPNRAPLPLSGVDGFSFKSKNVNRLPLSQFIGKVVLLAIQKLSQRRYRDSEILALFDEEFRQVGAISRVEKCQLPGQVCFRPLVPLCPWMENDSAAQRSLRCFVANDEAVSSKRQNRR